MIFSNIDLQKAFYQVPLNVENVPKSTIIAPFGLYEFMYIPFFFEMPCKYYKGLYTKFC